MKFNLDPIYYYFDKNRKNKKFIENSYNEFFKGNNITSDLKLNVDKVSKVYDNGIKALDKLSLELTKGEFMVFLGPSGCGKTTLLRMIAGLEKISDGYIKMNNAIINSTSPKDRNIAMVFQNYALYPFMSVFNNIKFGLKNKTQTNNIYESIEHQIKIAKNPNYDKIQSLKAELSIIKSGSHEEKDNSLTMKRLLKVAKIKNDKKSIESIKKQLKDAKIDKKETLSSNEVIEKIESLKTEIENLKNEYKNKQSDVNVKKLIQKRREAYNAWKNYMPKRIDNTLKMLGINMYSNRKPSELSGGQRQRVALARAISKQSGLFLYDEPLSNLDAKLRGRMRVEIRRLHDMIGSTSVYVTHDQIEAMSMADRIVVMNKGYIQQIGKPKELIDSPNNLFVSQFVGNSDVNIFEATKHEGTKNNKIKIHKSLIDIANSVELKQADWKKFKKFKAVIRPEHIITDKQLLSHIKINKFKGKVVSTEFLGNDILVEMKVNEIGNIRALFSNALSIRKDEILEIAIDSNRISLFENEYGFNILKTLDKYNEIAKQVWIDGRDERDKNNLILYKQKNYLKFSQKVFYHCIKWFSKIAKERLEIAKANPDKENSFIAKI